MKEVKKKGYVEMEFFDPCEICLVPEKIRGQDLRCKHCELKKAYEYGK
jgi:hypothetical protein